ncbi:hypothetical protein JV173_04335 [Acholeplasma equirhinis]|uniref:hypothetical protein n=1 Tax=Acholeplasma equirhinis TaxID=555393 RepID=UPI00197ABBF8|nr:hypothetical protein [Acholeplasma equirhinis]MBN3490738.1 hypothetical protein [Acholeplasma equirhinis]
MTTMKISFKDKIVKHFTTRWKTYIYSLVVFFSIVSTIFALGYSTTWATTEVIGKSYKSMQPLWDQAFATNDLILILSGGFILSVLLGLGFGTHNRKKYYLSNFITVGTTIFFGIAYSIYVVVGSLSLKAAFEQSFQQYQANWDLAIQLAFQSRDIRPDILASFDAVFAISLMTLIGVGLTIWLLVDNLLHRKAVLAREAYVQQILAQVEAGEIKVTEKVVNSIPSVDDEIIDFKEAEFVHLEHHVPGEFYKNNKLSIQVAYYFTMIITGLLALLVVGNFVFGFLFNLNVVNFTYATITGLQPSVVDFGMILCLLVVVFNLNAIKVIKSIKQEKASKAQAIGYSVYLIFSTIIAGILLLPVALKLKPSKFEIEKMRYQNNSFAYSMTFGSLAFFIWALFTSINYSLFTFLPNEVKVRPDFNVALDIAMSIVLILVMFLAAEKVKVYSIKWSIGLFVISAINILRIFYVPLISLNTNQIPFEIFMQIAISHVICAGLTIVAGIVSYNKSKKLQLLLKEKGV